MPRIYARVPLTGYILRQNRSQGLHKFFRGRGSVKTREPIIVFTGDAHGSPNWNRGRMTIVVAMSSSTIFGWYSNCTHDVYQSARRSTDHGLSRVVRPMPHEGQTT